MSIVDLLHIWSVADDTSGFTFLSDGEVSEEKLSYRELDKQARSIAEQLLQTYQAGDRVVLLYPPGLEFISGFFGCLYAGIIAVPAYPPTTTQFKQATTNLLNIIEDSGAVAILTTQKIKELGEAISPIPMVVPTLELSYRLPPELDMGSIAFLQYTSGSTSIPKGVIITHRNLIHNLSVIAEVCGVKRHTPNVSWLPLYHDMGLIGKALSNVYSGASGVLLSPMHFLQKPIRWLKAIDKYRAEISCAPNFAYDYVAKKVTDEDLEGLDLSCWRVALNGAEPISQETIDRFVKKFSPYGFKRESLRPCYGLAESTLMVSASNGNVKVAENVVSCGNIVGNQTVTIQEGEICVSGDSVSQGYWGKEPFEGGVLHTGDLGFIQDGELFVTGRSKDLIIIMGRNYYPQDIERHVMSCHPSMGIGAAIGIDGKLIILQEFKKKVNDRDALVILNTVRASVGIEFEVSPSAIWLLQPGQIPRTSSGKVKHYEAAKMYQEQSFQVWAQWTATTSIGKFSDLQPRSQAEITDFLVQAVAKAMDLPEPPGVFDSFADLGMTSLTAVEMTHCLEEWLKIPINPFIFKDNINAAEVSNEIVKLIYKYKTGAGRFNVKKDEP